MDSAACVVSGSSPDIREGEARLVRTRIDSNADCVAGCLPPDAQDHITRQHHSDARRSAIEAPVVRNQQFERVEPPIRELEPHQRLALSRSSVCATSLDGTPARLARRSVHWSCRSAMVGFVQAARHAGNPLANAATAIKSVDAPTRTPESCGPRP
jgi:hypothetical protein